MARPIAILAFAAAFANASPAAALESHVLNNGPGDGTLVDIPSGSIRVEGLPPPPDHLRIAHIDVVVRLVDK